VANGKTRFFAKKWWYSGGTVVLRR
jgi:hypothetical protein